MVWLRPVGDAAAQSAAFQVAGDRRMDLADAPCRKRRPSLRTLHPPPRGVRSPGYSRGTEGSSLSSPSCVPLRPGRSAVQLVPAAADCEGRSSVPASTCTTDGTLPGSTLSYPYSGCMPAGADAGLGEYACLVYHAAELHAVQLAGVTWEPVRRRCPAAGASSWRLC